MAADGSIINDPRAVHMPTFDHKNQEDVKTLASMVMMLPEHLHPEFAGHIVSADLIRTHRILHAAVWIGSKLHSGPRLTRWTSLFSRYPQVATEAVHALGRHIEHGTDRFDHLSAGGLSAPEITRLTHIMGIFWVRMNAEIHLDQAS